VDVPVKVDRAAGFDAPLKVTVQNLPPGVEVERTEVMDQGKQVLLRLKASVVPYPVTNKDKAYQPV